MWIKFTATAAHQYFSDNPIFKDGDVRQVKKEQGEYLCKTFSANFQSVSAPSPVEEAPPPNDSKKDGGNQREKAILEAKNKAQGLGK